MNIDLTKDFIEISHLPKVQVDLRYASTNNFMNENVYGDFTRAFLHRVAFDRFVKAVRLLSLEKPSWELLVLDALRPRSAQRRLFAKVVGTPYEKYVANPDRGSLHNFGVAIDLTLIDSAGFEIDMGTAFDEFDPRSEPSREDEFLANGSLSAVQIENRHILRRAMVSAGFLAIPHEWWHFNAMSLEEAKSTLKIVE